MTTTMKTALEIAGVAPIGLTKDYVLTNHATERIRQRVGIESIEVASAWVSEQVAKASRQFDKGKLTHYVSDSFEIIADGLRIVTVKPTNIVPSYVNRLNAVVAKEATKIMARKERELRKVEISIAEHTLNQLKARNPNTKALILQRLTGAINEKQRLLDEMYSIRKAAEQYGVEAS